MIRRVHALAAALCMLPPFFANVRSQTLANYSPTVTVSEGKNKPHGRGETKNNSEQERAAAIAIITSLADQSKSFKDQALKVRVQARAADALWESDSTFARTLFLRAWDTAENIDREGARAADEARHKFMTSSRGVIFIPPVPNLRSEVLRLVAHRDRALAETFLARLEDANDKVENGSPRLGFFDPTDPGPNIAKRLELATAFIKEGEVERAKAYADPALKVATTQGIIFLCMLRQKDASAADERYARLLELTGADPSADATTVSLLSSYVLTPNLLVTATRRGRISNHWSEDDTATAPSAELRASFIKLAASVLLRPAPQPDQDGTSAGRAGTYFTIARLLPVFERYAPDQLPALQARLSMLAPYTPENYRNNDNGMLTVGLTPQEQARDNLAEILAQLPAAAPGGERDLIYVNAIRLATAKGDERVREFAGQIDNTDLRKRALSFADFVTVRQALVKKDAESVVQVTRAGNMSAIQRVWSYAEATRLLKDSDSSRALQLLGEAASEARNMSDDDPDKARGLICVASQFFELDRAHAWEVADDAVKALNSGGGDDGDDDFRLLAQLRLKNVIAMVSQDVPSFSLTTLLERLAKDDFQRALSVANALQGERRRAEASLAVAHSLLSKKE